MKISLKISIVDPYPNTTSNIIILMHREFWKKKMQRKGEI